jgi:16S rRNA (cytidine1402-2'-O)-methyltransferase
MPGKLILLPNQIDETSSLEDSLPPAVAAAVRSLQGLIAESEKSARRYLRQFLSHEQMTQMPIRLLNEHTKPHEVQEFIAPMQRGECWGMITDAGLPCLADPGAELVAAARKENVRVMAIPGPSSLILTLQLSGLTSQRFAFHGYLPREGKELEEALRAIEKRSRAESATQMFIEAPYRSQKLFDALLAVLQPSTLLCVAIRLTSDTERVATHSVHEWKKRRLVIEKEPTVFAVRANFS